MGTYYVSQAGSDTTGDGSESTPYQTIKKAFDIAKAAAGSSHTIYVMGSETAYAETAVGYLSLTGAQTVPITIVGYGDSDVTISTASTSRIIYYSYAGNVTLENVTVTPATTATCLVMYDSASGIFTIGTGSVFTNASNSAAYGILHASEKATTGGVALDGATLTSGIPVLMYAGTITATDSTITTAYSSAAGIIYIKRVAARGVPSVTVSGCTLNSLGGTQIVYSMAGTDTAVDSISIEENNGTIGRVIVAPAYVDNIFINNNIFTVLYNSSQVIGLGEEETTPCPSTLKRAVINGNRITCITSGVNHIIFIGIGCDGALIANNRIFSTVSTAAYGIVVKADDVIIVNNMMSSAADVLYLAGSCDSVVAGNTFIATKSTGVVLHVDNWITPAPPSGIPRRNRIIGNTFRAKTGLAMNYDPSGTDSVPDWLNVIDGNSMYSSGTNLCNIGGTDLAASGGIAAVRSRWATYGAGTTMAVNDSVSAGNESIYQATASSSGMTVFGEY